MNKNEVIVLLKEAKQTPPPGAMERCIAALPEVHKPSRLLPLIKLQLISMPTSVIVLVLAAVTLQIILTARLRPMDALMSIGISSAIVALLFIWHLMLSGAGSMTEIEKCCKYSFGQILLSRMLCIFGLTMIALLAAAIPGAVINGMGMRFILAAILPTIFGALAALLWANYDSNSAIAMMVIYLISALIIGLMLERIMETGICLNSMISLAAFTALLIQIKNLINRRVNYEAYNY